MQIVEPVKFSLVTPFRNPFYFLDRLFHQLAVGFLFAGVFTIDGDIPLVNYSPNKLRLTAPTSWIAVLVVFGFEEELTIIFIF